MIRVVVEGVIPVPASYRGSCVRCGCVLECSHGDTRTNRLGGRTVDCPTPGCDRRIVVVPQKESVE